MLAHFLLASRRRRQADLPVDRPFTVAACIRCLGFFAIALFHSFKYGLIDEC